MEDQGGHVYPPLASYGTRASAESPLGVYLYLHPPSSPWDLRGCRLACRFVGTLNRRDTVCIACIRVRTVPYRNKAGYDSRVSFPLTSYAITHDTSSMAPPPTFSFTVTPGAGLVELSCSRCRHGYSFDPPLRSPDVKKTDRF